MKINLVTLCGQQVPTLPHMLHHYKPLVDDIYVIVHSLGEDDPIKERVQKVVDEFGCGVYKSVTAPSFDPAYATALYNEAMKTRPDDWWIIADPDEFQLYFDDIRRVIETCEANGWSYVGGHFLDRFGPGGTLSAIQPGDIWRQFPIAGITRSIVTRPTMLRTRDVWAPGWKICLAKGTVRLGAGQHCVIREPGIYGYPIRQALVQVHHFKWDSTVLSRHAQTLDTLKRAERKDDDDARRGYKTMYDYLIANKGKIDIENPKGLFAECPEPAFAAYPHWPAIVRHAPPFGLEVDLASWKSLLALHLWRRPALGGLFWWFCRVARLK